MDRNQEIRQEIAKKRLRQYEIAQILGISEFTFSRWLHGELAPERRAKILGAIKEAARKAGM